MQRKGDSMKKNLLTIFSTVMAVSLTACGGASTTGTVPDQSTQAESKTADGAASLTIWSPTDKESVEKWWAEKIDEWNKANPDIQVKRDAIDRSDSYAYDNKVATAVTSNSLPDIFFVDGPQVSYYAANDIIVPLDKYFTAEDLKDFVPSTVAQCTYDGKTYAISATESSVAFYYNKDMLREAGIDECRRLPAGSGYFRQRPYQRCRRL